MVRSVERDRNRNELLFCGLAALWGLSGCGGDPEQGPRAPEVPNSARGAATTVILPVGDIDGGLGTGASAADGGGPVCDPARDATCSMPPRCEVDCTRFVDIEARLTLLSADIARLATPEERKDVRYLDLSSYANAGNSARSLEQHRAALAFLLNSLSTNPIVRPLLAIDDQKLLFRIRLSDYGWNANTWERIASFYPYDVRYDPSSRRFPVTEAYAERLREATGTITPYIQADWFFSHAARPPLYYDILNVPASQALLEQQLVVDTTADVAALRSPRIGLQTSGESRFNRILQRHPLTGRGALWVAHDFTAATGTSNVLSHPLDFQAQSRHLAFHLPNGLLGFMIVDALSTRLDRSPAAAFQDPGARDRTMEAGISCLSCHADAGVISARDEVRAAAAQNIADPAVLAQLQGLYPEQSVLDALIAQDQERYRNARLTVQADDFVGADMHALDAEHDRLLSLRDVAGLLGLRPAALVEALDATPRLFSNEVLALRRMDARLARDTLDALLPDLVVGLGLGQVVRRP
jgi:hypothetical protein